MSDSIPRDTGKLWGAIKEIQGNLKELRAWIEGALDKIMVTLIGLDGGNGIRGDLRKLTERVDVTEAEIERVEQWGHAKVEELWHEKREPTCIGKKLIHDYEQRHIADHDRELEEREAANQAITQAIATLTTRLDNMRDRDELAAQEREKDRRATRLAIIGMLGSLLMTGLTVAGTILSKLIEKGVAQ